MLDGPGEQGNLTQHLDDLPCCALPPEGEPDFVAKSGYLPVDSADRRRFARSYFRRKAIVKLLGALPQLPRQEVAACVYLRDISRQGVGFLYHKQLFPGEQCQFYVPELGKRSVEVTSCRRLAPGCYSVGSRFLARE